MRTGGSRRSLAPASYGPITYTSAIFPAEAPPEIVCSRMSSPYTLGANVTAAGDPSACISSNAATSVQSPAAVTHVPSPGALSEPSDVESTSKPQSSGQLHGCSCGAQSSVPALAAQWRRPGSRCPDSRSLHRGLHRRHRRTTLRRRSPRYTKTPTHRTNKSHRRTREQTEPSRRRSVARS